MRLLIKERTKNAKILSEYNDQLIQNKKKYSQLYKAYTTLKHENAKIWESYRSALDLLQKYKLNIEENITPTPPSKSFKGRRSSGSTPKPIPHSRISPSKSNQDAHTQTA